MHLLKRLGLGLAVVALALAIFFVWASSGQQDDEGYAFITRYPAPPQAPRDTLTVVTYNVGYLSGMTNNRPVERNATLFADNMEAAAGLIQQADPDLIAFQEIDFGAARSYDVNQLDSLATRGDYMASAAAVNWDEHYVPFPSANPWHHFGQVLSGQAVLSRYPIQQQERVALTRPPTPFYYDAFYLDRLAQVVMVEVGRPLVLINVHLEAWHVETREQQASQVRTLYQHYAAEAPVILLGDFNSLLPEDKHDPLLDSETRSYFATDHTIDTLLTGTGLREAFADSLFRTRPSYTFPADAPTRKIDHLFYDPARIEVLDAYVVDTPVQPSDHRAVVVRFTFKK